MTPETLEFTSPRPGEPSAVVLLYGLAGVTAALEEVTTTGDGDREQIGNLACAADALAKLLVHRMANCPATPQRTNPNEP